MSKWLKLCSEGERSHCVACRGDASWRASLQRAGLIESAEFECPFGVTMKNAAVIQAEPLAESPMPFHALVAEATWEELHRRYLHHDGSDDSEWLLNDFTPRIRSIGCSCMGHWLDMLKRTPPRWQEAFAYFVERHNEVSARIERERA
jgi:hypothetical protein